MRSILAVTVFSLLIFIGTQPTCTSQEIAQVVSADNVAGAGGMIGGVSAGLGLTTFAGNGDAKILLGWSLSAFSEVKLSSHWFFAPEIAIANPGGASNVEGGWKSDPAIDSLLTNAKQHSFLSYVSIPLLIKFRLGPSGFFAGPQVGYVVAATENLTGQGPNGGAYEFERLSFYRTNRWDVGVVIGYEFLLHPTIGMKSIRASVRFYQGFLDVYSNDDATTLNQGFNFSVAIPLVALSSDGQNESD